MGDRIAALDEKVKALDEAFRELLAGIPNIPHESVPVGKRADDNVEVRRWGQPRQFDFEPKAHWDLGADLGHSGSRTRRQNHRRAVRRLLGHRAPAWNARSSISCSTFTRASTATPRCCRRSWSIPPASSAPANLPKFKEDLFKIEDTDFWLVPTAEVPGHQSVSRRNTERRRAAHLALRLHALLSQRGRVVRTRCARHHPPAPVPEGGAGEVRAARDRATKSSRSSPPMPRTS